MQLQWLRTNKWHRWLSLYIACKNKALKGSLLWMSTRRRGQGEKEEAGEKELHSSINRSLRRFRKNQIEWGNDQWKISTQVWKHLDLKVLGKSNQFLALHFEICFPEWKNLSTAGNFLCLLFIFSQIFQSIPRYILFCALFLFYWAY